MAERFLKRWSRLKNEGVADAPPASEIAAPDSGASPPAVIAPPLMAPEAALPTLEDVAKLGADSDYSAFVARGIDKSVQRLAMKKLFADPHFNLIDGLDIYMGDYNQPDPMSDAMLAALSSAKDFLVKALDDEPAGADHTASTEGPE